MSENQEIKFVRSKYIDVPARIYAKHNQQKELERVEVLTQSQTGASQNAFAEKCKSSGTQSQQYKRPAIFKKDQCTQTDSNKD